MAVPVIMDAGLWVDAYDIRGFANAVSIRPECEEVDITTFGNTNRRILGGLLNWSVGASGFFSPDDQDAAMHAMLGGPATVTVSATTTEGSRAWFGQALSSQYTVAHEHGRAGVFDFGATARNSRLVAGTLLGVGAKTATGNGAAYNVGSIATGQTGYTALHVTSISGTSPTLDVTIESDSASTFGSPVTRVTFNRVTAPSVQFITLPATVTDAWWRATWTLAGTSPSATLSVVFGII